MVIFILLCCGMPNFSLYVHIEVERETNTQMVSRLLSFLVQPKLICERAHAFISPTFPDVGAYEIKTRR
jgi:hypothetical protein